MAASINCKIKSVTLSIQCPLCGNWSDLELTYEEFKKATTEDPIVSPVSYPRLTVAQHELLIAGICEDCWKSMKTKDSED